MRYMTDIYPSASRVLCWLEEKDSPLREDIVQQAFDTLRIWSTAVNDESRKIGMADAVVRQLSGKHANAATPLAALFALPWFRRSWTLQEVCVSYSKPPTLMYGEQRLSWLRLCLGFGAMRSTLAATEFRALVGDSVRYVLSMLQYSWREMIEEYPVSLSYMIPCVANREATKPKDKIFSLLGLTAAGGKQYPAPDVRWDDQQVCLLYTRACISVDRSLQILYHAARPRPGEDLPSWCIKLDRMNGNGSPFDASSGVDYEGRASRYDAMSGTVPRGPSLGNEVDATLRLEGLPLDRVKAVHSHARLAEHLSAKPRIWRSMLERGHTYCRALGLPERYAQSGQSMIEAILRIFCTDGFFSTSVFRGERFEVRQNELYSAYQRHALGRDTDGGIGIGAHRSLLSRENLLGYVYKHFAFRTSDGEGGIGCGTTDLPAQVDPYIPTTWLDQYVTEQLLGPFAAKYEGCKVLITEQGHVGMARGWCRQGDDVCLLYGGSMPFLLRELKIEGGPAYELLGEVYLHGFMYGEAMQERAIRSESKMYDLV